MKIRNVRSLAVALAAVAALLTAPSASAAVYYWDADGTAAGFGATAGTWGTSTFWTLTAGGGAPHAGVTATAAGDTVNFGDATVNYANATVGVAAGGVSVGSITFGAGQSTALTLGDTAKTITLGAASTITLNRTTALTHTIHASLAGAATSLTKAGHATSVLVLGGPNTYSGQTIVNNGTLQYNNIGAIGNTSKIVTGSGGQVFFNFGGQTITKAIDIQGATANGAIRTYAEVSQLTFANTINLLASSTIYAYAAASTLNFNSNIGGVGDLTFSAGGAGSNHNDTFSLNTGSSLTYSGNTIITSPGAANAIVKLNGGYLPGRLLTLKDNKFDATRINDAVLDLNGYNQTLSGLTDVAASGGGGRFVVNTSGTPSTLTIDGATSQAFAGVIGVNSGAAARGQTAGAGNIALVKTGSGTQTLSGANTYSGATTVAAGTLTLGASSVLPDTTAVSIGSATLDATTFTDTVGTLDVTADATINLGAGAALAFADSSAIDWTGGTLNIAGTFVSGASLRFGTDSSGLTPAQLALISADAGYSSFALDGSGYLTAMDTVPPTVSTLSPADNATGVPMNFDLVITFNESVQKGTGNVTLKRISDGSVVETIPVTSGAVTVNGAQVTIDPASNLRTPTSYYVEIDAGAIEDLSGNAFAGIAGNTTWNFTTSLIAFVRITGDADCGISASKTYTHKLDFGLGAPGALINAVQFSAYNVGANGSLNFSRAISSGTANDHAGNTGHNVSGNLANLLTDMYYNGSGAAGGTTTWKLSGLTPGITYDTRIYTRQWAAAGTRNVHLVFDPDGPGPVSDSTGVINEDDATTVGMPAANTAYFISYHFTAVAGQDLVITATQPSATWSWHLYGLTTEVVPPPRLVSIVDDQSGGPILANTLVTYTVSFSEDMDAGTVADDDFSNAGDAVVTIGTVTETAPGVFSMPVTPTSTGSLRVQVNQDAVLKDVPGFTLNTASAILDDTTIAVDRGASWNVDADGGWATAGNWDPAAAPGSATTNNPDLATFSRTLGAARAVTVDATRHIGGIAFGNTSANAYTLQTGALYLNSGGLIQSLPGMGNHTDTIKSPIVLSGAGGGTFTISADASSAASLLSIGDGIGNAIVGSATGGNTTTLTLNGSNTGANKLGASSSTTIADGAEGGKLAVVKDGPGTWWIIGNNTFTGGLTIKAGTLVHSAANAAVGAGTVTLGDSAGGAQAAALVSGSTAGDVSRPIALAANTTGILTLGGGAGIAATTYSGGVTGNNHLTLDSRGTTLTLATAAIDPAGTLTVKGAGATTIGSTIGANVTGLTKNDAGTLTLAAANAYSGATTIGAGVLSIQNLAALGSSAVTVSGGQLLVDELTGTLAHNLTLSGVTAAGPYGAGALVFHNDGKSATLSGTVTLAGATQIRHYSGGGTTTFNNPIGGAGALTLAAGGATTAHNQIWVLKGGSSTYAGDTTITSPGGANAIVRLQGGALPGAGVLTLKDGNASSLHNDAVLDLNGNNQLLAGLTDVAASGGGGRYVMNSSATLATLTIDNSTPCSYAGVIGLNNSSGTGQVPGSGNIALVKQGVGPLTLSGNASTFTGNLTIGQGTVLATGGGLLGNPTASALGNPQTAGRQIIVGSLTTLNFGASDVLGNASSTPQVTLVVNGGAVRNNGAFFTTLGPVTLNGGTLTAFGGANSSFPSFALGGTVTVGGSAVSTINVSGSPANPQMTLGSAGGSGSATTFNVADATGDSAGDLIVSAALQNGGGNNGLTKTGLGTLLLSGANTYSGATTVSAGTLALGANNVVPNATAVSLGSATLAAASYTDTLGTLDVTGAATIDLGAGAALAFADSSAIDWTGGTLNITGTFVSGSSLRFGTTSGGLTGTQLALIRASGFTSCALDANGYCIATQNSGTAIIIK